MSTNQAHLDAVIESPAGPAQIRELSLSELGLVAGGLPHGQWATVGPEMDSASQETDSLPHGQW